MTELNKEKLQELLDIANRVGFNLSEQDLIKCIEFAMWKTQRDESIENLFNGTLNKELAELLPIMKKAITSDLLEPLKTENKQLKKENEELKEENIDKQGTIFITRKSLEMKTEENRAKADKIKALEEENIKLIGKLQDLTKRCGEIFADSLGTGVGSRIQYTKTLEEKYRKAQKEIESLKEMGKKSLKTKDFDSLQPPEIICISSLDRDSQGIISLKCKLNVFEGNNLMDVVIKEEVLSRLIGFLSFAGFIKGNEGLNFVNNYFHKK
jgi:predicted RNase H-like nuclease (RuvC/YqgF family)